jgi:heptosyltransferase-2
MTAMQSRILAYLPSPLGDSVLCTPALRALRRRFETDSITFLASPAVREALSPCPFADSWIELGGGNPLAVATQLKEHRFTHALLFKNSFGSALVCLVAGIPKRIGYAREGRSVLLTDRLRPERLPNGRFRPVSMVDYYLALPAAIRAGTADRTLELHVDPVDLSTAKKRLPEIFAGDRPVVVLVPGGAFGPSKCWPSDRFAETADWLAETYGARIVVSVAANDFERQIAGQICAAAKTTVVSLAERPISLGQLKALLARADLVVANDTGPRHMTIALGRKIITLFGPNDPAWTQTGYPHEVQLIGHAPCAPCHKPTCRRDEHTCMLDITVQRVCEAARQLLPGDDRTEDA